jgi:hypothetical protein
MIMHYNFEIAALTHEARIAAARRRHDIVGEHLQWRRRRRRSNYKRVTWGEPARASLSTGGRNRW